MTPYRRSLHTQTSRCMIMRAVPGSWVAGSGSGFGVGVGRSMQMRVAVVGASGYAGGELLRLIWGHPDLELTVATADSSAGKTIGDVHANLAGHQELANLIFEPHSAVKAAQTDLIFLALPGGQSAPMAAGVGADIAIVDLGPDFRLADPADWARHYGGEHPGRWVTGLPELPGTRPLICNATRVAAPGCYATAAILALAPLVGAGLVAADDVVVVAASGTSCAGLRRRALRPSAARRPVAWDRGGGGLERRRAAGSR